MAIQSPSTPKSKGGRTSKKTPGVTYDKTAYYLPESLAIVLQLAALFLKRKAAPIHLIQAIVEEALSRYVISLCKQKGLVIPEVFLPNDNPKFRTDLVEAMAYYQRELVKAKETAEKDAAAVSTK